MDIHAPKAAKRRKVTDKTVPNSIGEDFEDSKLYLDLLEAERKLDWTMTRKRMEIQDALKKVSPVHRTLRVFLSHEVENQQWQMGDNIDVDSSSVDFASGRGIPSWTFRVEGRLLDDENPKSQALNISPPKFTSFLRGLVIEMDRDQSMYHDENIVEWRNTGASDQARDGFEIKRRGDVAVKTRVILHLKRNPERYRLVDPLADLLDIKEDTRTGAVTALWHYIKANGLQDKVDRKIIRLDMKLKAIINLDQITFQQLPELINRCLKPAEPVLLDYVINVDPNAKKMQAFDIEIFLDDVVLKARMNTIHTAAETTKQITSIDDEIGLAAQSVRSSKIKLDFLKAFMEDPRSFTKTWLESQSGDLDLILGNEQGIREEDLKNAEFFSSPWADEAVAIQEGLRVTSIQRTQQAVV